MQYQMILDAESEGNFNTRSLEEVKRLIENLVFSNSTKNAYMDIMKSAEMDGNEIAEVKGKIDYVHELFMVEQAAEKDMSYINGSGFEGQNEKAQFHKPFQTSLHELKRA